MLISILHFRISAVPSYAGLRRFSDGRNFQQWTGDDSKALMKVCPSSDDLWSSLVILFYWLEIRSTSQPLPGTYLPKLWNVFQLLWSSVIYFAGMRSRAPPWRMLRPSWIGFTNFTSSLLMQVFALQYRCPVSMLFCITSLPFPCLGPQMAYAHRSQSQNISRLSRNLGDSQAASEPLFKCCAPLSG